MIDLDYYKTIASNESEMSEKAHEFKITLRDLIADIEREQNTSVPAETLVMQKIAEALRIAIDGWKRCYLAYGKEVMKETTEETIDILEYDKDWQKVNEILSNFSA